MFLKIDNININYKFINESELNSQKPIIVFLHEGLGSIEQWFGFDDLLCKELNLPGLSYDRYGYGKSSELKEKRSNNYAHNEANFLNILLKKLDINNPVIIFGHSDGATISLIYAANYPDNILAVISEAHHVIIEKETVIGMKAAITAYENGRLKKALEKFHPNKVDSMFYAWANLSNETDAEKYSIVNELKKIKAYVLAIQGDKDQYGTYKQLSLIEENCKNSRIKLVENCGHLPHREKTNIVIDEIKDFVKQKNFI